MILAAVVFFVVVAPMTRVVALTTKKKEATQRECPECLSQIPIAATRCMYCTAAVPPASPPAAAS